jgi:hypothetical protein
MMSKSVPAKTSSAMTTTNACMTVGEIEAESRANGFVANIVRQFPNDFYFENGNAAKFAPQ